MADYVYKMEQVLTVSEEILSNLENEDIFFEKILSKCKKLARMRNDDRALNWFILELHGYDAKDIPEGIASSELDACAELAGRCTVVMNPVTKKDERKYWTESVPGLESNLQSAIIALENLKPPSQFTPAVNKSSFESMYTGPTSSEFVVEKYQDVLNALQVQRNSIQATIRHNKTLLSKIRNNVYNYVLNVNLQLRFERITESLFQETKELVDRRLVVICPQAIKKFLAAYDRLKSNNPEEWSQSLSSCRNVLKEFADYVYPASDKPISLSNGERIAVTDDKYKNRLLAFIDKEAHGNKRRLLLSRAGDLSSRIHCLNDMLSQGTHEGLELTDVNICVIDTYLLIGSLLTCIPAASAMDASEKVKGK